MQVNGQVTQNENIADIGGLSHAFKAYQKYVSQHGAENRLPGLDDLSPEQLFFIGFASVSFSLTRIIVFSLCIFTKKHFTDMVRIDN